jgi:hypothetical protein
MEDPSQIAVRFKRLMQDLENGSELRSTFRPWEIELLLDFQSCDLRGPLRRRVLRRYTRAALRNLERGAGLVKLSEYLDRLKKRNLPRCA